MAITTRPVTATATPATHATTSATERPPARIFCQLCAANGHAVHLSAPDDTQVIDLALQSRWFLTSSGWLCPHHLPAHLIVVEYKTGHYLDVIGMDPSGGMWTPRYARFTDYNEFSAFVCAKGYRHVEHYHRQHKFAGKWSLLPWEAKPGHR